jgi:hypothetical protein
MAYDVEEDGRSIRMRESPTESALVHELDVSVGQDGERDFLIFGEVGHGVLYEV